jgi:hypothetical protein
MDCRRVFQDHVFFQKPEILEISEEVLYTWSKQHDEKYHQGMMYILDIVVFVVVQSDSKDHFADSFMIFDRILDLGLILYFRSHSGFLKRKCEVILNNYLKLVDVEFFIFLNKIEVDITVVIM